MRLEIAAGEVTTMFEYGDPGHPLGAALEEDLVLYPRDTVPGWIATALAEPAGPATAHRTHAEMAAATPTTARHDTNSPLFQAVLNAFEPDEPSMVYAKLTRKKQSDATPAEIFIEVGTDGYETRRVEVFPDGSADNASFDFDGERTRIDPNPVLPLTETVDGRLFVLESIAPSEFQAEWLAVEGLD
ncbi:DUF6881 domain-containing protein [Nocardia sp. NPDC057668]|uniref:DUF6881 domain-containing protein n=1 Tax=Nocardia sp. NPDC057668 TaxID=3346202 RepID=UPI0036706A53